MKIRAKFALNHMATFTYPSGQCCRQFMFTPQYDPGLPEDQSFSKGTPVGEFKMVVDNPPVADFLAKSIGQQFYFDIEMAEEDASSRSLPEAASFLNVSEPFVIDLVARGELPARSIGGSLRINFDDLVAYEKTSRTKQQTALDDMARLSQELGDI